MRYRKKPVEFEAWQYDGSNARELSQKLNTRIEAGKLPQRMANIHDIGSILCVGDWIVRDQWGNLSQWSPAVFGRSFEEIKEEPS